MLNHQVEEITDGAIPAKAMGISLSLGVAASVALSMVRVLTGLPILYFLVPGYGAQGGTAKNVQYAFDRFGHGAIVCAARSLLSAWKKTGGDGRDYVSCARQAAEKMRKDLGKYIIVM